MALELLRDDEPDPGHPGDGDAWQGPLAWQRRRGETVVSYFRGVARRAEPIVLPDGTPATATRVLEDLQPDADEATAWAVVSLPHDLIGGALAFAGDGPARFVPDPSRTVVTFFELALAGSIDVALALTDLDFARALYAALGNMTWLGPAGVRFQCSLRNAGAVVAALRGRGENYLPFYCSASEGVVRPDVAAAIAPLGWRPRTAADRRADHARLQTLLTGWIARPARHVSPWFELYAAGAAARTLADPDAMPPEPPANWGDDLLWWLARSARVSAQEYALAWDLADESYAEGFGPRIVLDAVERET
ncbi:hypothetical protein [Nannocystis punicea]|uniref:DUF4123 domain-containing protein n=1 Tax=Nannocystis punicea TaxID=2995304 RepID=A0ABY7HEC2_9BACT|nr:hypothetical protein [Nannocystis poenicansa]WAS97430.1 hypothetical protein O0S08_14885 [Nannocystis poenicansa]